jgi:hypothetical protein
MRFDEFKKEVFNHLSVRLQSAVVKDREFLVAEQANLADTPT